MLSKNATGLLLTLGLVLSVALCCSAMRHLSKRCDRSAQLRAEQCEPLLFPALLSEAEVAVVLSTANAMASSYDVAYGTAHAALFLHRGDYFAQTLPGLLERLTAEMRRTAQTWHGEEEAAKLRVRCIELHTYRITIFGSNCRPAA